MAARNPKLARERRHPPPRYHPLYRRKLELSAEHTALAFGHRSLLENCPLFLCLILGVHSTGRFPVDTGEIQVIYRDGIFFFATPCGGGGGRPPASRTMGGIALARGPSFRLRPSGYGGQ